jgi:uncharacterized protein involved in type VI secretion and phage assembly
MKEKIPTTEVLAWLQAEHPALHQTAAVERAWVWLTADLRGDHNQTARESIKAYGFRFARNGHALPDGKIAHWAHSCSRPIAFKRKGKGGATAKRNKSINAGPSHRSERPDPLARPDNGFEELAAAFV